jgi:hypothetical protein
MQFSPLSFHLTPLGPKRLPRHLLPNTLSLSFPLNAQLSPLSRPSRYRRLLFIRTTAHQMLLLSCPVRQFPTSQTRHTHCYTSQTRHTHCYTSQTRHTHCYTSQTRHTHCYTSHNSKLNFSFAVPKLLRIFHSPKTTFPTKIP